jgi:uncharacterized membrane protein YidH (DUF202 family)
MKGFDLTNKDSYELAKIRTEFAIERTYLAILRTSAIFIGISLLLSEKINMKLLSLIISLFCLIITIISTYYYMKNMNATNSLFEKNIPLLYSFLIIIVLFSIIIFNGINYIKIIKKKK